MTALPPEASAKVPRRGWLIAVGAIAAAAGLGGALWQARQAPRTAVPTGTLWSRRFARPGGGELSLAEFRGRPLLINFWATWCPPCLRELPAIDRFAAAHRGRLGAVGLAIDNPAAVQEFLARQPLGFAVGLAALDGSDFARELGNTSGGLPFTALLDASGSVARTKMGETRYAELEEWVARL